jgi:hypothetical protein
MKTLTINDEDYNKAVQILAENGIQITVSLKLTALRKGQRQPDESPADFGGIWETDERTLASIREKAWPRRS